MKAPVILKSFEELSGKKVKYIDLKISARIFITEDKEILVFSVDEYFIDIEQIDWFEYYVVENERIRKFLLNEEVIDQEYIDTLLMIKTTKQKTERDKAHEEYLKLKKKYNFD